ncbi:uncharacterized protein K452DRAFT_12324 [Aplosporella prunicola CBS 121167]|uniref:Uncharacterized protein n=1 Tax=Aplosporella prunicola CBS 121167 TaxID=1176127 RepID=A0A6A6BH11_9PEZI|nr:uncharacterized protein K452DRAFT_12324 [Aplosporella prunicola CBS 121167]KAF2142888.1 hypothetical protein K452DRAFT_12324 [Aplosporella prunicola CBS 121167]
MRRAFTFEASSKQLARHGVRVDGRAVERYGRIGWQVGRRTTALLGLSGQGKAGALRVEDLLETRLGARVVREQQVAQAQAGDLGQRSPACRPLLLYSYAAQVRRQPATVVSPLMPAPSLSHYSLTHGNMQTAKKEKKKARAMGALLSLTSSVLPALRHGPDGRKLPVPDWSVMLHDALAELQSSLSCRSPSPNLFDP